MNALGRSIHVRERAAPTTTIDSRNGDPSSSFSVVRSGIAATSSMPNGCPSAPRHRLR
jgi:hypothetical protein